MKLRADITILMEAEDYITAADHQKRITEAADALRSIYEFTSLNFRQLRGETAAKGSRKESGRKKPAAFTPLLRVYED